MKKFNRNRYCFSNVSGLLPVGDEYEEARKVQLSLLRKEVYLYDVHIKELSENNPNYDERNLILNLALFVIEDSKQYNYLMDNRKLSINGLSKRSLIGKSFITRWVDYIVFYVILFSNSNYKLIQEYCRVVERNSSQVIEKERPTSNDVRKGLVVKTHKRYINILTSTGEILKLKPKEVNIGAECRGVEKNFFKKNRFKILTILIVSIVVGSLFMYFYNKREAAIVVHLSSEIKYECNVFDRVINAQSNWEKGKLLIKDVKPDRKNIDKVLLETIKFGEENGMILEKGIIITISGNIIETNELKKTGEYIYEKKIHVDINNNGIQHKLYEIIKNQKEEQNE